MTSSFFEITAASASNRWTLPLTEQISVGVPGRRFMFGGVGMAASIAAIEQTLGRPVVCAAGRFLGFARPPATLDIEVDVEVHGHQLSQVTVVGSAAGARTFLIGAAVGSRPGHDAHQWAEMPDMPRPEDCIPALLWPDQAGSLTSLIEFRMARGRFGEGPRTGKLSADGSMVAWLRPRDGGLLQIGDLAVFADYIPSAVGVVLGRERTGGNSLDNTIRFHRFVPTQWALCSMKILSVNGGLIHGEVQIFSEDGVLMATASQSMIVRTIEAAA